MIRRFEGPELVLIAVVVLLWTVLGVGTDTFLAASNIQNILATVAPVTIIGVGMTAVIVTAGIDVSVGSALAVVLVVVAKLLRDSGLSPVPAIGAGVVVGGLLGAVNGFLVTYGRVHAIIITFGTLNVFRFVALRLFDGKEVAGVPDTLAFLGGGAEGRTFGVPHSWLLAVVLAAGMWLYMRHVPTGRHLYAIGGNAAAARLVGVQVTRRLVFVYAATGVLVGLAACCVIGGGGLVAQSAGTGLELQVIAAVVIGGTSILGGRGSVLGTVFGALLVGTVTSAVTLLGWRSELTALFIGVFILLAVGADLLRERRRQRL
ncbi:ABC transporter permease [Actinocrispum wychmicini]|uniref:Ribose transport system permease protein n=1 Tax=Actinocrispum wychmicini TaxID=1213861 RepID=A0A4R2JCU9_9PSEU|nr:ABC transporter permease [Actinocrispum wychmicini]TCO56734.1 ribose transport system permease protein [Actinocrispum wychmicini]